MEKEWKSNDEQLYTIFYEMVNAHWEDHLKELDIKHVKQGNTVSYGLIFIKLLISLCQATSYRIPWNGFTPRDINHGHPKSGNI